MFKKISTIVFAGMLACFFMVPVGFSGEIVPINPDLPKQLENLYSPEEILKGIEDQLAAEKARIETQAKELGITLDAVPTEGLEAAVKLAESLTDDQRTAIYGIFGKHQEGLNAIMAPAKEALSALKNGAGTPSLTSEEANAFIHNLKQWQAGLDAEIQALLTPDQVSLYHTSKPQILDMPEPQGEEPPVGANCTQCYSSYYYAYYAYYTYSAPAIQYSYYAYLYSQSGSTCRTYTYNAYYRNYYAQYYSYRALYWAYYAYYYCNYNTDYDDYAYAYAKEAQSYAYSGYWYAYYAYYSYCPSGSYSRYYAQYAKEYSRRFYTYQYYNYYYAYYCRSTCTTRVLSVPLYGQEVNNWCWAATCQMIMAYRGTSVPQCYQASYTFYPSYALTLCCYDPYKTSTYYCNNGATSSEMLNNLGRWGFYRSYYSGALSFANLQVQIDANCPFDMNWGWASGGGHAMVVHGYSSCNNTVYVRDSWPPGSGASKVYTYSYCVYVSGDHTWRDGIYSIYK